MWHRWELLGLQSSLSTQTLCFTSIFESQPCSFILLAVCCYAAVLEYQQRQNLSLRWIIKHPYWASYITRLSAFLKTKLVFSLSQWSCKFFVIRCRHLSTPQWLRPSSADRSCELRPAPPGTPCPRGASLAVLWEGWHCGMHVWRTDVAFSVAPRVFCGRSTSTRKQSLEVTTPLLRGSLFSHTTGICAVREIRTTWYHFHFFPVQLCHAIPQTSTVPPRLVGQRGRLYYLNSYRNIFFLHSWRSELQGLDAEDVSPPEALGDIPRVNERSCRAQLTSAELHSLSKNFKMTQSVSFYGLLKVIYSLCGVAGWPWLDAKCPLPQLLYLSPPQQDGGENKMEKTYACGWAVHGWYFRLARLLQWHSYDVPWVRLPFQGGIPEFSTNPVRSERTDSAQQRYTRVIWENTYFFHLSWNLVTSNYKIRLNQVTKV